MRSSVHAGEVSQVASLMRAVMAQNAFYDLKEGQAPVIDAASAAVLERKGLVKVAEAVSYPVDLVEILTSADHPKRRPELIGPIIFIREDDDRTSGFEVADLLLDERPGLREAAMAYVSCLPGQSLSARSRSAIEESRTAICSDDNSQWQPAAASLYGLLEDDYLLQLAGFSQSYPINHRYGVDKYLPRVLRPTVELIGSIDLAVWAPREETSKASDIIAASTCEATALPDSLDRVYVALGHLPLTGQLGIGGLVNHWAGRIDGGDIWAELWNWADRYPSPLPRYHVCATFLANPEFVPSNAETALWTEIAELAHHSTDTAQQPRWTEAWLFRNHLARHYVSYLACLLPGQNGERIAALAWWLTERFAESFPLSAGLLRKIRETTVAVECERSDLMSRLAHPSIESSPLRYLTQTVRTLWSTSILCEIGGAKELLARSHPQLDDCLRIEEGLSALLFEGYPPPAGISDQPVYGFEKPVEATVRLWFETVREGSADLKDDLHGRLEIARKVGQDDAVNEILDLLEKRENIAVHIPLAYALRSIAYTRKGLGPQVWELLLNNNRWRNILDNAAPEASVLLFEAFAEFQAQSGVGWTTEVPHFYALTAESSVADKKRAELFFGLTLFASIHSDSVGALESLLHGPNRAIFASFAESWRHRLRELPPTFLPWVSGRVRGVIGSLYAEL